MTRKNSELKDIASYRQSDKKASNLVSKFCVIDQSLKSNNCSASDLLFIILSVIYKFINQLYDERNLLHTSMNPKVKEAQMTATAAQLDVLITVSSEISVSVHKTSAIKANHKILMKNSRAMREKQINKLVSLKSEVKSDQKNTPKVVSAVVRGFQAETVAMKIENNVKLLDMAVKQRTLKLSHA